MSDIYNIHWCFYSHTWDKSLVKQHSLFYNGNLTKTLKITVHAHNVFAKCFGHVFHDKLVMMMRKGFWRTKRF